MEHENYVFEFGKTVKVCSKSTDDSYIMLALCIKDVLIAEYKLNISWTGSSANLNIVNHNDLCTDKLVDRSGNIDNIIINIYEYDHFSTWMNDLNEFIGDVPFNRILLPGTHDSGTYAINHQSPLSKHKASWFSNLLPGYAAGWAKAQDYSILRQLNMGVRYLDIRITQGTDDNPNDPVFYILHNNIGCKFIDVLTDIKAFYEQPGTGKEIVILDLSKIENEIAESTAYIEKLDHLLSNYLSGNMLPPNKYSPKSTPNEIYKTNSRVIVLAQSNQYKNPNVWDRKKFLDSPYREADYKEESPNKVLTAMNNNLKNRVDNDDKFFVLQTQLTPTNDMIVLGTLFSPDTLWEFTTDYQQIIHNWLTSNSSLIKDKGNILIEDFVTTWLIQYTSQLNREKLNNN